jgi:hypothetical protein
VRLSVSIAALCWLAALTTPSLGDDEYRLSYGRFSEPADLLAAVWNEFREDHPGAIVADWRHIADTCDPSMNDNAHIDCPDLVDAITDTIGRDAALVMHDGATFCPWGRYFVQQRDDYPPFRYQLIDTDPSQRLALFCGPMDGPILVRLRAQGEPAGIVSPDLQLYLSNLQLFAPRGPRSIWAHLEFFGFDADGGMLWRLREFGDAPQDQD